jgi:hypothetical protein
MPNLPPGATILLDCPFNSVGNPLCNGQVYNFYNAGSIVSDGSAPESPPNIYRYFRGANDLQGGTQLEFTYQPTTELYYGLAIRTSPTFRGLTSLSNKIILPGSEISDSVTSIYGQLNGPFTLVFNDQNGGTVNNCHLSTNLIAGGTVANGASVFGDCPGGLSYFPNLGVSGNFSLGQWHYVEWCGKASASYTSRDGIYKWFLDGRMIGNYSNVNTGHSWSRMNITPTWDGQGTPWGADAWWDIDRWVVARLSAGSCAGMTGNGVIINPSPPSSPQPPPPPVGPVDEPIGNPSAPVGLIVTDMIELPKLEEFK